MRPAFFSFFYGAFFVVAGGLIVGGVLADPEARTNDGYNLKNFLFFMSGVFLVFPALIIGMVYYFIRRGKGRLHHLLRRGQNGKATILSAEQTGLLVDGTPQFRLRLRITTDSGETYDLSHEQGCNELSLSPSVGQEVAVYIDPENKQNVLVMWEEVHTS